jgi:hypothetical protein
VRVADRLASYALAVVAYDTRKRHYSYWYVLLVLAVTAFLLLEFRPLPGRARIFCIDNQITPMME